MKPFSKNSKEKQPENSGELLTDIEAVSEEPDPDMEIISEGSEPNAETVSGESDPDNETVSGESDPDNETVSGESDPDSMEKAPAASPEKRPGSVRRAILMLLTILLSGIGALTLLGIRYMFKIWAGGSVQELVFTMTGNLEGVNPEMVFDGVLQIVIPVVLLILVYILLQRFLLKKQKYVFFHLINLVLVGSLLTGSVYGVYHTWKTLDVTTYLAEQGIIELHSVKGLLTESSNEMAAQCLEEAMKYANADQQTLLDIQKKRLEMSFIDANFVDPKDVELEAPEQMRNLILIFLESMESTYSDKDNGGAYDINYIPELTALAEENESFAGTNSAINGARVLTYSTWTMAGIFAHTGGLPLNIPVGRNQMDTQETFLPAATTLGDILDAYGYNQAFQCGSDVSFGGRKAYFNTHGGYEFHDLNDAWATGAIPNGRKVWWGYEDEHLFDIAKEKITEMASRGEPFNYTMLTVDTHYPDGYMCSLCGNDKTFTTSHWYRTPYGNVLSCSSTQVAEFIDWIKQQDFYENTSVVLLGDHLTMDKNFCSDIDSNYARKTYVNYMNSAVEPELGTAREYVTEDSFPTILASMGFKIMGNKLGLGTNLFSSVPTLLEEYGYRDMDAGITMPSDYMTSITSDVDISAAEGKYNVYHANINVSDLDPETNSYTISVTDVTSSTGVGKITLALNTYEDESDNVWVTAYRQPDDTYQAVINASNYDYNPEGTIKIEAYVYDWSWRSHFLNKTYLPLGNKQPPAAE